MNEQKQPEPIDQSLQAAVKARLDLDVQAYDGRTLSKLNQARQQALDAAHAGRSRFGFWRPALTATLTASVAIMALNFWSANRSAEYALQSGDSEILDDLFADTAFDNSNLDGLSAVGLSGDGLNEDSEIAENLDFYWWLSQQPEAQAGHS